MSRASTRGLLRVSLALLLTTLTSTPSQNALAATAPVRQVESSFHGFLVLRNQAGATVASGEVIQAPRKGHMSVRLVFHFKDGSVDDETTEYTQDQTFHLISDRHVQRGPFFPHPLDASIDMASQQVRTVALDKGPSSASAEHLDLPADLSNGIVLTLIKNLKSDAPETKVSFLAFSPKSRLVKLAISKTGTQSFHIAGRAFPANHYVIKVDLGGITGLVAPIIGKQPSDLEVWTSLGKIPAIVRVDAALYLGGPILSIQLANPTW